MRVCAAAGILNGGVLSTLLDCHGNWTAAIALMDRSCLPKPPLTLTASMLVRHTVAEQVAVPADLFPGLSACLPAASSGRSGYLV